MSFKTKLVRGLAAAATITAMSAGALLAAAPAHAADGDRMQGPLIAYSGGKYHMHNANGPIYVGDATTIKNNLANAVVYTFPAPGSTGPVMLADQCLTKNGDYVTFQACDGGDMQDFFSEPVTVTGSDSGIALRPVTNTNSSVFPDASGWTVLRWGGPIAIATEVAGTSVVAPVAPAVADLVVTSPADGAVVDGVNVAMTGTGEPGETVTITDSTGAVLGTTTVGANGNWSVTIPELPEGPATLTATSGDQSVSRDVVVVLDKEDTPIMALAGVGALGLFAAGGAGFAIRRRRNAA